MLAATLLAALCGVAPTQEALRASYDPERLHLEAVHAERARNFLDAWLAAGPDRRTRARRTLERLRPVGSPAAAAPSLPVLTRAWRALVDPGSEQIEPGPSSELQLIADALDLRPVPGLFAARKEGEGELITVRVAALWRARPPGDLQVSLWWLPPAGSDGLEERRARSEPATQEAFTTEGFEMFVRPPASPPGLWRLVVELEHEGVRVRGVPVPVECLDDTASIVALALEALESSAEGERSPIALGLLALARAGARLPAGLPPSRCEAILRDPLRSRPQAQPRPVEVSFRDPGGRARWTWAWLPERPPRVALVLLAPTHEPAEAVFAGEIGRRWRALARDLPAVLLSTRLPRPGTAGTDVAGALERVRAIATRAGGDLPLVIVARGDTLPALDVGLGARTPSFEALVAVSPLESLARPPFEGLATLLVAPGEIEGIERAEAGFDRAAGDWMVFLDEPLLPDLARTWLHSELPDDQGGGDRNGR